MGKIRFVLGIFVAILVAALSVGVSNVLAQEIRASDLLEKSVKNDRGDEVGQVDDLILTRTGKVDRVVLSVGGFLGIGDRLVAVSFDSLKFTEKGNVVYNISKEQLANRREFSYDREGLEYGDIYPRGAYDRYDRYGEYPHAYPYGRGYYGRGYRDREYGRHHEDERYRSGARYRECEDRFRACVDREEPFERERGAMEDRERRMSSRPEMLRASFVLDQTVVNHRGDRVGEIEDLLISPDGSVKHIVLSVGGFLGIGEKRILRPFPKVNITPDGEWVLNISKRDIERAKDYKEEHKKENKEEHKEK